MQKNKISANEAWKEIIKKYDIINRINENGIFHIKASEIKEFKEPRLMAKWDCTSALPEALRNNKINILPNSRSSYVLGRFNLYEELPELTESVNKMDSAELPALETIDINSITSESAAICILIISGILDDFLGDRDTVETFNGRMGTGEFDFSVNTVDGGKQIISVKNAQCEIDGGFENDKDVIILEAKNVVHEDFHIRQLYYPYRLWEQKVSKPIRLVFSVYSNMIFRLFEYRFLDKNNYSSIELVKAKNYSLQETHIEISDLVEIRNLTKIIFDDDCREDDNVPFIQANSFERVISLLENLKENTMTKEQIAELMEFDERQSDYYYNAGAYLGLFVKRIEGSGKRVTLTRLGEQILTMNYKERQLKFVQLMLQHQIFADCFDSIIETGELIEISEIEKLMRKYNVCKSTSTIHRRASSVQCWIKWVFNLVNL